jgi:hypothetical protein
MPDVISLGTVSPRVLHLLFRVKLDLGRCVLTLPHQTLIRRPITAEERVHSQASPRGISREGSGIGSDFFFLQYFALSQSLSFQNSSTVIHSELTVHNLNT